MSKWILPTLIWPKPKFWMKPDDVPDIETMDKLLLRMTALETDLGVRLVIPTTYPMPLEEIGIIARNNPTSVNISKQMTMDETTLYHPNIPKKTPYQHLYQDSVELIFNLQAPTNHETTRECRAGMICEYRTDLAAVLTRLTH